MGPRRKKSRPNTQQPTPDTPAQAPDVPQHNPQEEPTPVHSKSTEETDTTAEASKDPKSPPQARSSNVTNKAPARSSWYAGGSWRAKASPVAQVARESISVAGGMTSESSAESSNARPTRYMHNSLKRSSKSIPIAASETRIHATSSHSEESIQSRKDAPTEPKNVPQESSNISEGQKDAESKLPSDETVPDPPLPPEPSKDDVKSMNEQDGAQKQHAAGWFGWWSRPDGYASDTEKAKEAGKLPEAAMSEARSTPLPTTPGADLAVEESDATVKGPDSAVQQDGTADVNGAAAAETTQSDGNTGGSVGRSWFGLWSRQQNRQTVPQEHAEHIQEAPPAVTSTETAETAVEEAFKPDDATTGESTPGTPRATEGGIPKRRSSGWAFWSKDRSKDGAPSNEGTQKQVGELAVADTPSQSHPEAAQFNEQREQQQQTKVKEPQTSAAAKIIRAGRGRSSTVGNEAAASAPQSPVPTRPGTPDSTKALEATKGAATKLTKQTRPNLVIPKFRDTYPPAYIPTYLERVTGYLASSLRIADAPTPPQHVSISPTVPKIQSAIAIGVHGYFPAPLLQKVLGQPTGTSIRFANYASAAVRSWIDEHQPDVPCDIETVALEGEGFIDDRVNTLWKLLLNWLSHLRTADLILVACHSQGVPVAVVLVSKLIQLGCLSPNVKIGVCAMAGVNLGPFSEYKSRFVGGSMAELFEFSRADSKVSKEYRAALDVVFRYGVRITYIGSLDDQLVPLESSLFAPLSHPYAQRAVFVDGLVYAPSFLSHLVAFALKLRNLGLSDHGLIRELSAPLAGSLYGGNGHSRVYDDPAVYRLALDFALETTDLSPAAVAAAVEGEAEVAKGSTAGAVADGKKSGASGSGSVSVMQQGIGPVIERYEVPSAANANPYFLPWALRGILEEEKVKKDMQDEVKELVREFEEWKPQSKVLQDVRWRLEGVRSKL